MVRADRAELPQAFASARAEASKAFGDPTIFMEQLVHGARHLGGRPDDRLWPARRLVVELLDSDRRRDTIHCSRHGAGRCATDALLCQPRHQYRHAGRLLLHAVDRGLAVLASELAGIAEGLLKLKGVIVKLARVGRR